MEDAARWMVANHIEQWRPGDFDAQSAGLRASIVSGELYVARRESGGLDAAVVLSRTPDPIWLDQPEASARYLHKLVVANDLRGGGVGAAVLRECERIATQDNARWVRLDCVASNMKLARYYQALGYYPRGVGASGRTRHGSSLLRHDKRLGRFVSDRPTIVSALDDVDFDAWRVDDVATLCFVTDGDRVLLIHKKRGHGAGKINAPGGKVEAGETPLECAVRETREEVGIEPMGLRCAAELRFQDTSGYAMRGFAFVADGAVGVPHETPEAKPFWCPIAEIPFAAMWDDDRIWLPRVLGGDTLVGEFLIHHDRVVEHRLQLCEGVSRY